MKLKQRIRRDAKLVAGDPEAAALHECLVKHLFSPALDLHFLGRECRAGREAVAAAAVTLWSRLLAPSATAPRSPSPCRR